MPDPDRTAVGAALTDEPQITARALRKVYGTLEAVRGIDFEVHLGECVGFLGPNGAGKTSVMRMIGCAIPRTAGDLRILKMDPDRDPRRIKSYLGIVPQDDNLDTQLSVLENLLLYGRYHNMSATLRRTRARELLEFFVLSGRSRDPVRALSGGMRRRLLLARGLIHAPQLLLLDEPTTGLDPQARHMIWAKLQALKRRGTTLLVTTHYMEEAEYLCDRILIMEAGRIIAQGSPRDLIRGLPGPEVVEFGASRPVRERILEGLGQRVRGWEHLEDRSIVMTEDADSVVWRVSQMGLASEVEIHTRRATLEDVFLQLTGRRLTDDMGA